MTIRFGSLQPGYNEGKMPGGRLKKIQRERLVIQWEWLESPLRWDEEK